MYMHPREILHRLRLAMVHGATAAEREEARRLYDQKIDEHTRPTLKDILPIVWP
jgi:hypothetical protein